MDPVLKFDESGKLERRLASEQERLTGKQGQDRLLREVVGEEEIAEVVSAWTGIPLSRLREGGMDRQLRTAAAEARVREALRAGAPEAVPGIVDLQHEERNA